MGDLIVCTIVGVDVGDTLTAAESNCGVGLADEGFNDVCTSVGVDVGALVVVSKPFDGAAVSNKSGVGLTVGELMIDCATVGVDDDDDDDVVGA